MSSQSIKTPTPSTKQQFKLNLNQVRENPQEFGNKVELNILEALIKKANHHYYNTEESLFSDATYDILRDKLEERNPDSQVLQEIGAPEFTQDSISTDDKVKLPIHMGSMSKKKTQEGLVSWMKDYRGDYVISDKLDGASALFSFRPVKLNKNGVTKNMVIKQLITRGDGTCGRDISHLIHYMKVPKVKQNMLIRGELIISKTNFNKFTDIYSSSRAMVNGIMGCKTPDKEIVDNLDFVAFELVRPIMKPSEQFKLLESLGFKLPKYSTATLKQLSHFPTDAPKESPLEGSFVLNQLIKHKSMSDYDIDGIIITDNHIHERNTSGNPKYSIAFKSNGIGKLTKVVKVHWNASKHGVLIPTIEVEPVYLGSNIKNATGFNAKYIYSNNIGGGAEVRIIRSGDVIPYISEIVKPAKEPDMPEVNFVWNKTGVNILLENPEDNQQFHQKQVLNFFRTIGVENLSVGLINRLIEYKYDTISKILNITKDNLLEIDGIKTTMANKIYNNIHLKIDSPLELSQIMAASLKFGHGYGQKRFIAILKSYPNIMDYDNPTVDMIMGINGFSQITAKQFVDNLPGFKQFLLEHPMIKIKISESTMANKQPIINGKYQDKKIVITGFRDNKIEEYINNHGGAISNTINKKTSLLIIKDEESKSKKLDAAQLLGIPIMTKEQFYQSMNL